MTRLQEHPDYWSGQEHHFYYRTLRDALTLGVGRYTDETERRQRWYQDSEHVFPGLLLVGCLLHLEGKLGQGWIQKYGASNKRELYALRITRNAFVHFDGDLKRHRNWNGRSDMNARQGRPADSRTFVRRFASDLRNQLIRHGTDAVPPYLEVSRSGIVKLNGSAVKRIGQLFQNVLHEAGQLPNASPRP